MTFPVIKATAYALVHTPNILLEHGTTQIAEAARSGSEYEEAPEHLRSFEEVVAYPQPVLYRHSALIS